MFGPLFLSGHVSVPNPLTRSGGNEGKRTALGGPVRLWKDRCSIEVAAVRWESRGPRHGGPSRDSSDISNHRNMVNEFVLNPLLTNGISRLNSQVVVSLQRSFGTGRRCVRWTDAWLTCRRVDKQPRRWRGSLVACWVSGLMCVDRGHGSRQHLPYTAWFTIRGGGVPRFVRASIHTILWDTSWTKYIILWRLLVLGRFWFSISSFLDQIPKE